MNNPKPLRQLAQQKVAELIAHGIASNYHMLYLTTDSQEVKANTGHFLPPMIPCTKLKHHDKTDDSRLLPKEDSLAMIQKMSGLPPATIEHAGLRVCSAMPPHRTRSKPPRSWRDKHKP
jgi:hypothetical protein